MQAPRGSLERTYNLTEIIGLAFRIYLLDWRGFVALGAILIPFELLATLAQGLIDDIFVLVPVLAALVVVAVGASAVVEGAVIHHMLDVTGGVAATETLALSRTMSRVSDLMKAVYRTFFITVVFLPTIVGSVYLGVRWIYVVPSVVIDRKVASTALAHSAGLVKNNWWRTFGRLLVLGLLLAVLTGSVSGLATSAPILLYALVSAIADAFANPFFFIAITLSYFDLKARKGETEEPP